LPVFQTAGQAMDEQHGGPAPPLVDEIHSSAWTGLCAATSFCWSCGGAAS
jgi:hypothetical protein